MIGLVQPRSSATRFDEGCVGPNDHAPKHTGGAEANKVLAGDRRRPAPNSGSPTGTQRLLDCSHTLITSSDPRRLGRMPLSSRISVAYPAHPSEHQHLGSVLPRSGVSLVVQSRRTSTRC
jgi:hypothetical protein